MDANNERNATLATLSLKIDTSDVPAAIEALNRLAEAAERARSSLIALGDVSKGIQT